MQEEHQQAIQEWDNQIQAIQYANVGLRAKDQDLATLQRR